MTVGELIEQLKTLDQDKGIWVIYDYCAAFAPIPDGTADEDDAKHFAEEGVELGDYVISAN